MLTSGESVTLVGDLELAGDFFVLSNGYATYRFHWSNVTYCRSRENRS
jgi:hypothetical protein